MIIPFFLMNRGCRRRCLFCNESLVAPGSPSSINAEAFHKLVGACLASAGKKGGPHEIAFYGGTFTGLDQCEQRRLLDMAAPYIKEGSISGIRISTRPDEISADGLELLSKGGVRTVEVGAQSLDDKVLESCRRGHTASDIARAIGLLKERGFVTGLHLMLGLPGETPISFPRTVERAVSLAPAMVRLHPTVVLRDTPLAEEFLAGRYEPLPLDEAIRLCADALRTFTLAGIRVIRLGLQTTKELEEPGAVLAGPFHPSFRDLVEERIMYEMASSLLARWPPREADRAHFLVSPAGYAHLAGPGGRGLRSLKESFMLQEICIQKVASLPRQTLLLKRGTGLLQTDWSGRIIELNPPSSRAIVVQKQEPWK